METEAQEGLGQFFRAWWFMRDRLRIQTQVLLAPRPTLAAHASEMEARLGFLIQMPSCSEAGELESSENNLPGIIFMAPVP